MTNLNTYMCLILFLLQGHSAVSQTGSITFDCYEIANQLMIEDSCEKDSSIINFKLSKELRLDLLDIKTGTSNIKIYADRQPYSKKSKLKRNPNFKMVYKSSDEILNSFIRFYFLDADGSEYDITYGIKSYLKIFSSENLLNDTSMVFRLKDCGKNQQVLFKNEGTITSIQIQKNNTILIDSGYYAVEPIEFDFNSYGYGEYLVKYKTHYKDYYYKVLIGN